MQKWTVLTMAVRSMLGPEAIGTDVMRARRRGEYQASHCLDNNARGENALFAKGPFPKFASERAARAGELRNRTTSRGLQPILRQRVHMQSRLSPRGSRCSRYSVASSAWRMHDQRQQQATTE